MNKLMTGACVSVAAVGLAAGCAYGSGKNSGGDQSQPAPQTTGYCSIYATNCGPQPTSGGGGPIVSADAAPQAGASPAFHEWLMGNCSLDVFPPGVGLAPGVGLVLATGHVYCRGSQPWENTLIFKIQICLRPAGQSCMEADWMDAPGAGMIDHRLPPEFPDYTPLHVDAECLAGAHYRLVAEVSGISASYVNGVKVEGAPYGKPLPLTAIGEERVYSKSECTGA
jgi:hypothetical protein